jgi:hypothetical protein
MACGHPFRNRLRIAFVVSWSAKTVIYDNAINITGNGHLASSEDAVFLALGQSVEDASKRG